MECQANIDVGELELTADYEDVYFEFYESGQSYVDDFDLRGTGTYRVRIRSRVATNQADVQLTNAGSCTRTDVQDNNLTGASMDATDATNINSGNNSVNWVFTPGTAVDGAMNRGLWRGVLKTVI